MGVDSVNMARNYCGLQNKKPGRNVRTASRQVCLKKTDKIFECLFKKLIERPKVQFT